MIDEENKVVVVDGTPQAKESITNIAERGDDILFLAEEADKKVQALKKVMTACLSVTSHHDWVLIGGKPYLQESGCTKVANLLGISFEVCPGFPIVETDESGYKTFTFRIRAFGAHAYVEGEGQRSMRDEFFSKGRNGMKAPEEINERDVRLAALTNAKANAIKSIIPGLKNLEIETLTNAGLDASKISGFSFKTGKDGGKTKEEKEQEFECERCHKKVSGKVASFSQSRFNGMILCVDCQSHARVNGQTVTPYDPDSEED